MFNKFFNLIQTLTVQEKLADYSPVIKNYHLTNESYWFINLPLAEATQLKLSLDDTFDLQEQHLTVFENLEGQGEQSAFHYTAKFNSKDDFYIYRVRVFTNNADQPLGVSWYRKHKDESDQFYTSVEKTGKELKLIQDFAAEQIKPILQYIRMEQAQQVIEAKGDFDKYYALYVQYLDEQSATQPLATDYPMQLLGNMNKAVESLFNLGDNSYRKKQYLVNKLSEMLEAIAKVVEPTEEISSSATVPSPVSTPLPASKKITRFSTTAPSKLDVTQPVAELEALLETQQRLQQALPVALTQVPARSQRIVAPDYLVAFDQLIANNKLINEKYLQLIEIPNSNLSVAQLKKLNKTMSDLNQNQEKITVKGLQTILLFSEPAVEMLARVDEAMASLTSLPFSIIKLLIRKDYADTLESSLAYKLLSKSELIDLIKAVLTSPKSQKSLEFVLKQYRVHAYLLERDEDGVMLASYLLRLPINSSVRLSCLFDIPALYSPEFYQKLNAGLLAAKSASLYDLNLIKDDMSKTRFAENLYASASEQKHVIRKNIEWLRKLPLSVQEVIGNLDLAEGSQCYSKITLISEIALEIKHKLDLIAVENPRFVETVKQESNEFMCQVQTNIFQDEEKFANFIQSLNIAELESQLDAILNYSHAYNNYLRYCLPTSICGVADEERKLLREHYFRELQEMGMNLDPYQRINRAIDSMRSVLNTVEGVFTEHLQTLERMKNNRDKISKEDVEQLCRQFKKISSFSQALLPAVENSSLLLEDTSENNPDDSRLNLGEF